MRESSQPLAGLRQRIARLAATGGPESRPAEGWLATGHDAFDSALGGGLAVGRTHEFFAADALDGASAAAFAALVALRTPGKVPLLWLGVDGRTSPYARLASVKSRIRCSCDGSSSPTRAVTSENPPGCGVALEQVGVLLPRTVETHQQWRLRGMTPKRGETKTAEGELARCRSVRSARSGGSGSSRC